jgi:2-oxo-3-hexenedioate decarboxylase
LDDAYRITARANEMRVAKGYRPVGRKIGFTNRRIWDEYGVHAPVWGYVYDRTLHDLAAPLPLAPYSDPKIEPEIMFGLAKAPSPGMDDAALLTCVAWVAHGYEMVQSIYPGWKFAPPDAVIVDAHHGALLIGPHHEIGANANEWLRTLASFEIELFCDGKPVDNGYALNVLDGPLSTIRYLMDLLARDPDNPPLTAGEIVSTGTLTRALPVKPGETWTTALKGIALENVTLRFC